MPTDLDALRAACADPDGPLYGSDLVPMIGDLIDRLERLQAERQEWKTYVQSLDVEIGLLKIRAEKPTLIGSKIELDGKHPPMLIRKILLEADVSYGLWILTLEGEPPWPRPSDSHDESPPPKVSAKDLEGEPS